MSNYPSTLVVGDRKYSLIWKDGDTCPMCDKPFDTHAWLQPAKSYLMPDGTESKVGICFDCQATVDRDYMLSEGHIRLFVHHETVYNFGGSLMFHAAVSKSPVYTSIWFEGPDGYIWYGRGKSQVSFRRTTRIVAKTHWGIYHYQVTKR